MARFLDRLDVRLVGSNRWMTLTQFRFESDVAQRIITVPAEFITDFSSVPRAPLAYLLAGGRAPGPATIHDYGYQHPDTENRPLWDAVFLEAMTVNQPDLGFEAEAPGIRDAMWAAVRSFGWIPWSRHRQRATQLNPIWTATAWPEVQVV